MEEDLRICTKSRYQTEVEAKEMAQTILDIDRDTKLKTYKCHICHNWHLTSRRK